MKRSVGPSPVSERLALLGEAIRLRILRLLETEELSVGEVARVVQLPQSTVSRHLKLLAEGGWLGRRSVGTATYYRMVLDDLSIDARALWLAIRGQVGEGLEIAEDARRLEAVLAERPGDSEAFFGRIAGEWDALRRELFGERFTPVALLSLLPRDWVVADLGCGTGDASEWLAPIVERVVAVDRSGTMLQAARKRLGDVENVDLVEGQLEKLPLADRSVDAAVCLLVMHHMAEPVAALSEMARIVRTDRGGGIGMVVDMVEHDRDEYRQTMGHVHLGFSEPTLREMFREAGFGDPFIRGLPRHPDAKGPGLFVATARPRARGRS